MSLVLARGSNFAAKRVSRSAPLPPAGALQLAPPTNVSPTTLVLNDAAVAAGQIDLFGAGKDYVVQWDDVITKQIKLHGRGQARNLTIIGGELNVPLGYDESTLKRPDGAWWAYSQRGFSGATGGTFTFRVAQSSGAPSNCRSAENAPSFP